MGIRDEDLNACPLRDVVLHGQTELLGKIPRWKQDFFTERETDRSNLVSG